jgi:hypothetical protein
MLSTAGLAIAGSLCLGITGASAQAVYVDPYAESYPVVVAPGSAYVAPAPIVVPRPIVRERTVVVRRPAYAPAPVVGVLPVPRYDYAPYDYSAAAYAPYDYTAEVGYVSPGW